MIYKEEYVGRHEGVTIVDTTTGVFLANCFDETRGALCIWASGDTAPDAKAEDGLIETNLLLGRKGTDALPSIDVVISFTSPQVVDLFINKFIQIKEKLDGRLQ